MSRKVLSLILSSCLIFLTLVPINVVAYGERQEEPMSDITQLWAQSTMSKWIDQGLLKGNSNHEYRPDQPITRAEFVALLNRIFKFTAATSPHPFTDVSSAAWYADDISKVYAAGIIKGIGDSRFMPEANISREDAAVMVSRASRIGDVQAELLPFTDRNLISTYALDAVTALHSKQYIKGRTNGMFAPKDKITRAESVTLINNVMGTLINAQGTFDQNIIGNLIVNTEQVKLSNVVVSGDLYITQGVGEGDMELEGVTVKGNTYVMGGGMNSITIRNSDLLGSLIIDKWNSLIRIVATGTTQISETVMLSGGMLAESELEKSGFGFANVDVQIPAAMEGAEVTLSGEFEQVRNLTSSVNFKLMKDAIIRMMIFNVKANVTGEGQIELAEFNVNGVVLEKWPTKVKFANLISATIDSKLVTKENRIPAASPASYFTSTPTPDPEPEPTDPTTIVEDGLPKAEIIIGSSAGDMELFAGTELQSHIKLISGANLPIIRGDIVGDSVSFQLMSSSLKLTKSGNYPIELHFINNGDSNVQVDLTQSSANPITVSFAAGNVELAAKETKVVEGIVHVPWSVADGTHSVAIQASMDNEPPVTRTLTVTLDRNVIKNGGFEVLDPKQWWVLFDSPTSWDDQVSHSGNQSLRLEILHPTENFNYVRTDQDIVLKPGGTYKFRAWVKGEQAGKMEVWFREMVQPGLENAGGANTVIREFQVGEDWTLIETEYTHRPEHAYDFNWINIQNFAKAVGGTGTLWIDDVSLTEVIQEEVSIELDASELNLNEHGNYPIQLRLTNNGDRTVQVDMTQSGNNPITVSFAGEVELEAKETKLVEGIVHMPSSVIDGTHSVAIQASIDNEPPVTRTLTITLNRNVIKNGGFEVLDPKQWWVLFDSPTSWDDQVSRSGNRSLRLEILHPTVEFNYVRTDQDIVLKSGGTYKFRAWVKGEQAGKMEVWFREMVQPGLENAGGANTVIREFQVGTDWTLIETEYTHRPEHAYDFNWINIQNFSQAVGGTGTLWIDDVTLTEVMQEVEVEIKEEVEDEVTAVMDSNKMDQVRTLSAEPANQEERVQIILATPESFVGLSNLYSDDLDYLQESDGFAVRKSGNRIFIIGSEPKGVLNGAYDFLEKNTGILWTRSKELGTIYEEQSTITATNLDYREKSPFQVRGWHLTGTGEQDEVHSDFNTEKLLARNKLNGKFAEFYNLQYWDRHESIGLKAINLGHNLEYWLPNEIYFDSHPEYYNVQDGQYVPVNDHTQINFYHADVPGIIANRVKQFHSRYGTEYIGIGINDNHNFTQSAESKLPFTTPAGVTVQPSDPAYKSTVFYTFLNKIAAEVKLTHPDVKIVTFAYFFTEVPPKVDLEDNIVIVMAPVLEDERLPLNTSNQQSNNYRYRLMLEEWKQKTDNIIMYNYYGTSFMHVYERPIAENVKATMQYYAGLGILGVLPEGLVDTSKPSYWGEGEPWGVNALQFWLFHKLFWNPDADIEQLKNEFIQKAYGDAAEPMRRYYDLIEQGWEYDQEPIHFYHDENQLIGQYVIAAGIQDDAQEALDEAWAVANTNSKARIAPIKTTFEKMTALVAGIPRLSANAHKTTASKEDILQSLDFSTGPWTSAEPITNFLEMKTKNSVPVETKVYLLWDDTNFYVGYENFDNDPDGMLVSDDAPNGWWRNGPDDSVETFVAGIAGGDMFAFFTNPKSVKFAYKTGQVFSPETQFEANSVMLSDRWNTVQVIPFASIGVDPQSTNKLKAFFFRDYHRQHAFGNEGYFGWGGGSVWISADMNPINLVD